MQLIRILVGRCLITGLLARRSGLDSMLFRVTFMVKSVALGQTFHPEQLGCTLSIIPPMLHTYLQLSIVFFYVLLTVHLSIIVVNKPTWRTPFSYMFISILYMFRAAMCPSSGELIVSVLHLVYVTLCRWPSQTAVYTEWHIPGVALIQLILLMMGT